MTFNEQIGELSIETITINTEPNRNSIIKIYSKEDEQFTGWVLKKCRVSDLTELSLWTNLRKRGEKKKISINSGTLWYNTKYLKY